MWKETEIGRIPNDWQINKIGEIADVTKLAGYEYTKHFTYVEDGEVIALRALNVREGVLDLTDVKRIYQSVSDNLIRSKLFKGDILFTYVGANIGQFALVDANDKYHLAPNICRIRAKKNCLPFFLFSYFRTKYFKENLNNYSVGSSQPTMPMGNVRQIKVPIPPLIEQVAIADVLSSLDDKIDLLHRQNKTLEQLAETLFKQWFVEEANENWEVGKLSDFAKNIQYGFTQSASWENIGPRFLRITDIQGGNVNWEVVPFCASSETEFSKYELKTGDVVIARTGASTGENLYIYKPEKAIFASYLIRIQFSKLAFARYAAMHMRSSDYFRYIEGILSGSAQPNANANELSSFEISLPPEEKLNSFFKIVTELDEKKHFNQTQIHTLAQLRDMLLPKLMSGEVRVEN